MQLNKLWYGHKMEGRQKNAFAEYLMTWETAHRIHCNASIIKIE